MAGVTSSRFCRSAVVELAAGPVVVGRPSAQSRSHSPDVPPVEPVVGLLLGVEGHADGGLGAHAAGVGGPRQLLPRELEQPGVHLGPLGRWGDVGLLRVG